MAMDIVAPEVRSRIVSSIKSRDTQPEILVRRMLHRLGFRFRLHSSKPSGRPDIVLPRYRAVIFVNGCFWHGHGCGMCSIPKSRVEYWHDKIEHNRKRDECSMSALMSDCWCVAVVWECSIMGKLKMPIECLADKLAE